MAVYVARRVAAAGFIALFVTPIGASQTSTALRARGAELGFNLDYAEALAAFRQASAADPQDAAAFRLTAANIWTTELFEQGAITVADFLGQARANVPRPSPDEAR